jgi:ferredoxin
MAYVIAEPCIDVLDQSCVSVCPVDCIHFEEGVDRKLYIDPNECIDCGACEPECPVNAIFPEESLPPSGRSTRRSMRPGSPTRLPRGQPRTS